MVEFFSGNVSLKHREQGFDEEPEHRRPQDEKHKATRIKNPSGAKQPKGVKKEKQSANSFAKTVFSFFYRDFLKDGTPGGIRTPDFLLPKQTLLR